MTREEARHIRDSPDELLGTSFRCECGKVHTVPVRKIVLEENAYLRLPEVLTEMSLPRVACVVADDNTFEVLGRRVVRLLSSEDHDVREVVVRSAPGETVRADQATAEELVSSLPSVPLLIAVGSGTINDLTKLAASKREIPYVVLPTAPSMNGYTSSIVALTVGGLKTTSEARPPIAVVADLNIVVQAPMELITAGVGDIVSKPVSTADWKLAEIVDGGYFCSRPIELVEKFEPHYMNNPAAIRARRPEAIRALTEALLYSGISMVIAGSSSPASGGEHLISHTLDMQADLSGRQHGYHGAQVGVATIFSAALYERVLREELPTFDLRCLAGPETAARWDVSALRRYWGSLAEPVKEEFSLKLSPGGGNRKRMSEVQKKWDRIRTDLGSFLKPWPRIKEVLQGAGAPTRIADIGVSLDQFRQAVLHAREMRRRYTILDLAADFGLLEKHLDSIIRETDLWAE